MIEQTISPDVRPLRVLMVSDFYPPIIGGLERHVQTLAHELARRGHHVAIATLWHAGSPACEHDRGVRVHRLRGWNRALAPFYQESTRQFHPIAPDPGVMAGLRRVIAHERPHVIHAHSWMLYSALPLMAWSGARLVVTLHDYSLVCPKKNYLHGGHVCDGPGYGKCVRCATGQYGRGKALALTSGLHLCNPWHARVDRFLAISNAVRNASLVYAAGRPIEVVPTFVPDTILQEAQQTKRPAFLPAEDGYLLFVGNLSAHKGLPVLLAAYAGLSAPPPLVLLGTPSADTPQRFPVGVTVARNVPHAQVMAAWARCALGVVPSVWPEPFGHVAVEAMASGRAVVASAVGGLPDVVADGETGLLTPPGDVGALRDALAGLLGDPERRERLGVAGRARARQFMASVVTERIEQVHAELLADPCASMPVGSPPDVPAS